nr:non-structural maintenance of chromosomes element 3 homolog [Leptinotarsa decemlineata]
MPRKSQRTQHTQNNTTLTQKTLEESFEEVNTNTDEQVNDLVRYIVNRAGEHMSFKRSEIKKNVLPKAGPLFQQILETATNILKNVYGYNVIVVDAAQNSTKAYIVSNGLSYFKDPTEHVPDQEYPEDVHKILIMLVLSHIFMSNNSVSETSLYSFLNSLKIDVERKHEIFGNVKDYITNTMKNKKYLNVEMDQFSKKTSFSWGTRAEKEISKHDILKFVCKIYRDRLPNSWVNQFKVASEQQFENHKESLQVPIQIDQQMEQ